VLPLSFVGRDTIITVTLVVIWLSVFVMGASVKPLIKLFNVKKSTHNVHEENMARFDDKYSCWLTEQQR
jgi:NhaP-type Na+/H+ or K+/H+ antiporter